MQFGSAGVGSGTHVTCLLLNAAIGIEVTHVPYRGELPVVSGSKRGWTISDLA
jgi:tripartite-type tricarboxylate transporter receptor subunit TctC